jgi:hypothetical protein
MTRDLNPFIGVLYHTGVSSVCRLAQSTLRCIVATALCTAAVPLSNVHRLLEGASKYAETDRQTDRRQWVPFAQVYDFIK